MCPHVENRDDLLHSRVLQDIQNHFFCALHNTLFIPPPFVASRVCTTEVASFGEIFSAERIGKDITLHLRRGMSLTQGVW